MSWFKFIPNESVETDIEPEYCDELVRAVLATVNVQLIGKVVQNGQNTAISRTVGEIGFYTGMITSTRARYDIVHIRTVLSLLQIFLSANMFKFVDAAGNSIPHSKILSVRCMLDSLSKSIKRPTE